MRSCAQQAAAALQRQTTFTAVPISTAPSHHNNAQHVVITRLPKSPPTSPRHLDPADPELVQQLRRYLLRAAQRPAGISDELESLLQTKLGASLQELEALFDSSKLADVSSYSSPVQPQQLQELQSGLDHMLQLFSPPEVLHLLQQQPALLYAPLASWCEFFMGYGFSSSQIKNLISQTQGEVMTKGTLVTAGDAIMHLKALGFDNDEIRHRVVAYCPQVLAMSTRDIDMLIRLWDKFKFGVDEQASC